MRAFDRLGPLQLRNATLPHVNASQPSRSISHTFDVAGRARNKLAPEVDNSAHANKVDLSLEWHATQWLLCRASNYG